MEPRTFNPERGLVYVPINEAGFVYIPDKAFRTTPLSFNVGADFGAGGEIDEALEGGELCGSVVARGGEVGAGVEN